MQLKPSGSRYWTIESRSTPSSSTISSSINSLNHPTNIGWKNKIVLVHSLNKDPEWIGILAGMINDFGSTEPYMPRNIIPIKQEEKKIIPSLIGIGTYSHFGFFYASI
jgi:hypothetical protein